MTTLIQLPPSPELIAACERLIEYHDKETKLFYEKKTDGTATEMDAHQMKELAEYTSKIRAVREAMKRGYAVSVEPVLFYLLIA